MGISLGCDLRTEGVFGTQCFRESDFQVGAPKWYDIPLLEGSGDSVSRLYMGLY